MRHVLLGVLVTVAIFVSILLALPWVFRFFTHYASWVMDQ